eukprot:835960-Prymnesium_polylepis.1
MEIPFSHTSAVSLSQAPSGIRPTSGGGARGGRATTIQDGADKDAAHAATTPLFVASTSGNRVAEWEPKAQRGLRYECPNSDKS